MRRSIEILGLILLLSVAVVGCKKDDEEDQDSNSNNVGATGAYPAVEATFGGSIDLNNLLDYGDGNVPVYINKDNTNGNFITDAGATLGRVLFYDKSLSVDYTISCSSCHQQSAAFSDIAVQSDGVAGVTGRHSMRLINSRFADESRFFWDERAFSLEEQTTMPIQDHIEMGWSGEDGDLEFNELFDRLEAIDYYQELFTYVYGTSQVTEDRIQLALAQFIRSFQSFDSKFDEGMADAPNAGVNFNNYTAQENNGKGLFLAPADLDPNTGERIGGGLGCGVCHRPPEFDIDPNSANNGVIGVAGSADVDTDVTRSPSLRDLVNPEGGSNGPFMHDGSLATLDDVIDHYNNIPINPDNDNLDPRLSGAGNGQQLNITDQERNQIIAFLETLTGEDIYTNEKWSDPF
ncbi:cytochrome-c peroxidase [Sanyastnella coralliicola]|uniref:cytochrome-c peroxidase n=1 Tax=Sanyastnella coralliicola TaxID=3069118 RepID=UPI0027BAA81A|nr:cytochrome c peroxidase [Longitalea sp. SCSIO 12813]